MEVDFGDQKKWHFAELFAELASKMSDSDNEESETMFGSSGFHHMNEHSSETEFSLEVCGFQLSVRQDPSCVHKDLGHGATVWDAAIIFAKYLEQDKQFSGSKMQDKRVIELGSGTGLAGFSLMLKGAVCTLTDLAPVVEHILMPNIASVYGKVGSTGASSIHMHRPTALVCDWTAPYPPPDSPFDVILLTDCVFSPALAKPLVGQLVRLADSSSTVLCCHEIRDEEANDAFVTELATYFHVKSVSNKKLHRDFRNDMVQLLQCKLKRTRVGKP
jgi:predicted nicotinamide N-methyase